MTIASTTSIFLFLLIFSVCSFQLFSLGLLVLSTCTRTCSSRRFLSFLLLAMLFELLFDLEVEFLSDAREYFLYVVPCLRTSLEYFVNFLVVSKFHSSLESDLTLVLHLTLVTNQIHSHVLRCMLFDFFEPVEEVDEGFFTGHIISQEYAVSSTIENTRY